MAEKNRRINGMVDRMKIDNEPNNIEEKCVKKNGLKGRAVRLGAIFCASLVMTFGYAGNVFADTDAYVSVKSANVRQSPVDGENIASIPNGTSVTVVEEQTGSDSNSWSKVLFNNNGESIYGWIRSDLITEGTAAATDTSTADASTGDAGTTDSSTEDTSAEDSSTGDASTTDAGTTDSNTEDTSTEDSRTADADTADTSSDTDAATDTTATGAITNGTQTFDISGDFKADQVPDGFSTATVTYDGNDYMGVSFDQGELQLLYLVNAATEDGAFFVCDSTNNTLYPYVTVSYGKDTLILLQNTDSSALISGSDAASIVFEDGTQLEAYQYLGDKDVSDFYEVYAMNESGECDWYSYDSVDQTCQRLNLQESDTTSLDNLSKSYDSLSQKYQDEKDNYRKIIAGLVIVSVILIFVIVNLLLHRDRPMRGKRRREDDFYEEDGIVEDGIVEDGIEEDGIEEDGIQEDGIQEDDSEEDGIQEEDFCEEDGIQKEETQKEIPRQAMVEDSYEEKIPKKDKGAKIVKTPEQTPVKRKMKSAKEDVFTAADDGKISYKPKKDFLEQQKNSEDDDLEIMDLNDL